MLKKLFTFKAFAILLGIGMVIVSAFLFSNTKNRKSVYSDGYGYYSYLPAIIIDQDLTFNKTISKFQNWYPETLVPDVQECQPQEPLCNEYYGFRPQSNQIWADKYPVGLAVIWTPFFFAADLIVQFTGSLRDGYSPIYQYAIALCGMIFFQFGLYFSYKIFRGRFTKKVSLILLSILVFGTNLIHYAVYEPSMSHIYSFTLITACLYLLTKYLTKPTDKLLFLIGLLVAFIGLVRNSNFVFAIIPFIVIFIRTPKKVKLKTFLKTIMLWGITTLIVFIPQILYWVYSKGSVLTFSYVNETFNLLEPHIFDILFNIESNGLFVWHPLLILAIPGFYFWIKTKEPLSIVSIVFLIFMIYLLSTWWAYWFGFSFGHRAFTDFLILFMIPMGYLIKFILKQKEIVIIIFFAILIFLILQNFIQISNYWRGIVGSFNLTWENYLNNYFNPNIDLGRLLEKIRD